MAVCTSSFLKLRAYAPDNTTTLQSFAISPDGRLVAFAAEVNGKRQLWLRALDALQAQPVRGTEDARFPFWSPDSRYIAFFAQGKLNKIAAGGGPAESLCDAPFGAGGSWSRNNVILFAPNAILGAPGIPIRRVSADGGVPADVIGTKGRNGFPVFLPDGRHFLYVALSQSTEQDGVYLSSLDGKENLRVLSAALSPVVWAAGRLLFIREDTLMAQPFDVKRGHTMGEAFQIAEGVSGVSVSETGLLLYQGSSGNAQLAWYDRGGKLLGTASEPGTVSLPRISPDERSLVFVRRGSDLEFHLWLRDLARGTEQRFTTEGSFNSAPVWSPQGDRIAFLSIRAGIPNLYQKPADGTGQAELLLATGVAMGPTQWSRDGRFIVYMSEFDPKTKRDLWVLPMEHGVERKPIPFLHSQFNEMFGQLSPDSHWMAYASDESGQNEVYVQPFPAADGRWKISIAGGSEPRWRGDGQELFFVSRDGSMNAVAVHAALPSGRVAKSSFQVGTPEPLFETHLIGGPNLKYDVTVDGKRFVLATLTGSGSVSAPLLTMVVNWDAGLKK